MYRIDVLHGMTFRGRMLLALLSLFTIFVVLRSGTALYGADIDAGKIAATIGRYLRADHSVVVHTDLTVLSAKQLLAAVENSAVKIGAPVPPEFTGAAAQFDEIRGKLIQAGAKDVFVLASMEDLTNSTVNIILPTTNPQHATGIAELIRAVTPESEQGMVAVVRANAVVVGDRAQVERIQEQSADVARTTALQTALTSVAAYPIQIVLLPDMERRVLRDSNPSLPLSVDMSARDLAESLESISLGISGQSPFGLKFVIETPSPAAAERLDQTLTQLSQSIPPSLPPGLPAELVVSAIKQVLPKVSGKQLVTAVDDVLQLSDTLKLLQFATENARGAARNSQSVNNLKQLALAFHNFESANAGMIPAASYDDQGQPLLSWRVFLLPYLGEQPLFEEFRLNEPWDSDHNRKLIKKMPATYLSTEFGTAEEGKTCYLAPIGPTLMFHGPTGRQFADITDGTSQTILFAEVAPQHAVIWTKPSDWQVDLQRPKEKLARADNSLVRVAYSDGSVHSLDLDKTDDETWRRLLEIADGQQVEPVSP